MIDSKPTEKNQLVIKDKIEFSETEGVIQFKIVYWGPGESGKTTNFLRLGEKFNTIKLTNGYSIETTGGRTLWQDTLFLSFKFEIKGKEYTFITQIVTCTGQERFLSTREYVLDGADGIVFVADSGPEMVEQNKRSFRELLSFTSPKDGKKIPYVIQLNKRDLMDAIPINEFKRDLGLLDDELHGDGSRVVYPAVALQGKNVVECYQDLLILIIFDYFNST
jgi:signal recognition particle receptor subunit beta